MRSFVLLWKFKLNKNWKAYVTLKCCFLLQITWKSVSFTPAQFLWSANLRSKVSFPNWTRGNSFKTTNKHPTIPSSRHGYKSRKFEEICHTYNALEQLWSGRQFSRSEANSPRTNRPSFACFPREWVARCSIFVSRADLRSRLWPSKLTTSKNQLVKHSTWNYKGFEREKDCIFITQLSIRWSIDRCKMCYYCLKIST